ncbi:hypothetical protein [Cloacibacillus evryensis]|uniref:hypothetical protein n=1 Tax=Cloacibacillus evryensis TaxID=508460 RepID=UPI00241C0508|nr:hypothetical protein [Cloacibacillus evryensis]
MKITDEAREVINTAFEEKKANAIRFRTINSCCGKSLRFELIKLAEQDHVDSINGLSVLMDGETRAWTDTVTIGASNRRLTISDSAAHCCD